MRVFCLFYILSSCVINKFPDECRPIVSSYSLHLHDKGVMSDIQNLYFSDSIDYNQIIYLCNQLKSKPNKVYKEMMLSYVYEDLNQPEKFNFHLKNAVSLGYYTKEIKSFRNERLKYINNLDTSIINMLIYIDSIDQNARTPNKNSEREYFKNMSYVDSITVRLMDSLINENNGNWLGFSEIGNLKYDQTVNYSHDISVHHMSEIHNHRYLKLIIEACEKDNEYWSSAEGIKWQQLNRFINSSYNFMKIRRLNICHDSINFQDNETLLTVNEVSKLIRSSYLNRNQKSIIYPTQLIKNKDYKSIGLSLLKQLKVFDIEQEVTFDSSVIMPMDSLEKIGDDYPFVIKTVTRIK